MYCSQCGTENRTDVETCTLCGSPLTPRSGPETCSACGGPVDAYDRFCAQCGAALPSAPPGPYTPGPSFEDDDLSDLNVSELPPWLQDLAPQNGASAPEPEPMPMQAEPDESTLPEWLVAARSTGDVSPAPGLEAPAADAASAAGEALGAFSLVGEDDLPEWLRVLGDEESAAASADDKVVRDAPASSPAAVAAVPSVSRAWLARPRAVDAESAAEARRAFVPVDHEPVIAPERPAAPVEPAVAPVAPAAEPVASESGARTRRVRILILLVALAVLALLLILWYTGSL